ncbi:MAG: Xaa-Pro peptidase family protein [Bacteroidota bacterium]
MISKPIEKAEFESRISKAVKIMQQEGIHLMYLNAGTNLYYFTGLKWGQSERMVGAILTNKGAIHYIAPKFELGTIEDYQLLDGDIHCWEEDESPYQLFWKVVDSLDVQCGRIAMDEQTPFFISNGIIAERNHLEFKDAKCITAACRSIKSNNEIAIMQNAMDITLMALEAASKILRPGITSAEVSAFIHQAHIKMGAPAGNYFCIVLFGVDTSFPHGVKQPKPLEEGDVVLMDTGCKVDEYISDITRTYVFGEPTDRQRSIWQIEKATQAAAFDAAQIGVNCGTVDDAARACLVEHGLGPDYQLPGTSHRTGHGIGLDIHEWEYIVRGNKSPLKAGMCFSNEPMICVPDEFGIRLEDHIFMTEAGPQWFTQPSFSIDEPFKK